MAHHLIQWIGISNNLSHFSFLSRIFALNLSSFPKVHSPVTHVYQYLQKFHPQSTPLTTLSPSSHVFLFPQSPLSPVSTGPSLSLSSCVSKTHTGEECQPATPEWEEKVIKHLTNQLYPCRGNTSTSHSNTHLS